MATPLPLGEPWPKDNRLASLRDSGSFHAYVHIPFCDVHCGYCDFNTYTAKEIGPVKQADFHLPLIQEIEFSRSVLAGSDIALPALSSVFFGGGTPSLFSIEQISALLDSLSTTHGFLPSADITIEAI